MATSKKTRILAALALCVAAAGAIAQGYPDRPVTLIVPYPTGGSTDVLGRLAANKLSMALKQPVVVQNKPGAGGNIGSDFVAKSNADGYTLLLGGAQNAINATLYKNLPFELTRDLRPVAIIGVSPNIMVVPATLPVKTPAEFIAYAKEHAGKVSYASSGNGATTHMAGELFKVTTGVQMTHIPYKGSAPALTDLVGGQTQVMFDNIASALPLVKGGQLRALAITGPERNVAAPEVPTLKELGIPVEATTWFCIFAPAATPPAIVDQLNQQLRRIVAEPDFRKQLAEFGATPVDWAPDKLMDYTRDEVLKWRKVVQVSGATID